jgi:NTP pyrophosphatase (non-canonical NTP hydrolase)
MTFNDYQIEAMKNKVYGYGSKVTYPVLGLTSEAGEVSGKLKKVMRDMNGDLDSLVEVKQNDGTVKEVPARLLIADEIGDVLWYAAAIAEDLGYTFQEIAEMNITKLTGRRERGTIQGSGDHR